MRLGTYIVNAVTKLCQKGILSGKTNIQKVIYFALPEDQRKTLYYPYHYGPYCSEVQQSVNALLKNSVLVPSPKNGFTLNTDWEQNREADPVVDRISDVVDFLSANDQKDTPTIANLAKVHLLSKTDREDALSDLPGYIQNQARFLGWHSLTEISRNEIERYLSLAEKLDAKLLETAGADS
jgi:uncharacterized protein YwgA